jgi:hypothetical protein
MKPDILPGYVFLKCRTVKNVLFQKQGLVAPGFITPYGVAIDIRKQGNKYPTTLQT